MFDENFLVAELNLLSCLVLFLSTPNIPSEPIWSFSESEIFSNSLGILFESLCNWLSKLFNLSMSIDILLTLKDTLEMLFEPPA